MANKGKNKCKRGDHGSKNAEQEWFTAKKKRNRKNKKLVKASKKRNR